MSKQKVKLSTQEMLDKVKELAKLLDGLSRDEALIIAGQLPIEIINNSMVVFSPIY